MSTTTPRPRPIADVPLPGMYDVLTAQLNITLHPALGTCKYVLTLRDPSPLRQVELSREGGTCAWVHAPGTLSALAAKLAESMNYLAAMPLAPT